MARAMKLDFVSTSPLSPDEEKVVKSRVVRLPFWSAVEEWAAADGSKAGRCLSLRTFGIENTDVVGCHIIGREDRAMVALGRHMGLPRGFDVLFVPKDANKGGKKGRPNGEKGSAALKRLEDSDFRVVYGGFFPKFSNDDNSDAIQIPDDATSVDLSFKLSGSLIKLTFVTYQQRMLCLASTKNAASESSYVASAKAYLKEHMSLSRGVVEQLDGCCVCGEFMDVNDQSHGSRVLKTALVVTSVATSNPTKSKFFMEYARNRKLAARIGLRTADELNIRIDDMDKAREIFARFDEHRDELNMEDFIASEVEGMDGAKISTLHRDILPDRLEGLVVRVHRGDKATEIFKYKFYSYTNVTMGVRRTYGMLRKGKVEIGQVPSAMASVLFRWASDPYSEVALTQYRAGCRAVELLQEGAFQPEEHVLAYNAALKELKNKDVGFLEGSMDLYVVCGPIGGGKSTFAERLAARLGLCHIDGDCLWSGFDATILGYVRNDVTTSRIVEELSKRGAAVISCGGGVLSGVREAVFVMLRRRLNIHLLAPTTGECSLSGIEDCWEVHHSKQGRFREVLEARAWKGANDIEARSRNNLSFAKLLFRLASSVTYYSYSEENRLLIELPALIPPVSSSITCRQWRLFATVDSEKASAERHITVQHAARTGGPLECASIAIDCPRVLTGRKLKVFKTATAAGDGNNGKNNGRYKKKFVGDVIDLTGVDLGSSELPADLGERAHITLKCGANYAPEIFADVMADRAPYEIVDEGKIEAKIWGQVFLR